MSAYNSSHRLKIYEKSSKSIKEKIQADYLPKDMMLAKQHLEETSNRGENGKKLSTCGTNLSEFGIFGLL
jgi:hypothetical protein